MDAATRRLDSKRLKCRTVNGNLCLRRLTHRVTPPMTVKAAPSLSFDSLATTPLPERGLSGLAVAKMLEIVKAHRWIRQEDASEGHPRSSHRTRIRQNFRGRSRHRQHGRLRLRRDVPGQG